MPPLHGPRELLCCTRNPSNTLIVPSSILMGRWRESARRGERNTSRIPLASLSFCAAVSNCCMAIRKGFRSSVIVATDFAVAIRRPPGNLDAFRQTCEYTPLDSEPAQSRRLLTGSFNHYLIAGNRFIGSPPPHRIQKPRTRWGPGRRVIAKKMADQHIPARIVGV